MFQLKKKEHAHLSALTEEWKKKCTGMETKINHSMEQCRRLAQSLSDTIDELRLKISKNVEREQEVCEMQNEVNEDYFQSYLENVSIQTQCTSII
jgi:Ni,Fe-hydrogenase I large subunit